MALPSKGKQFQCQHQKKADIHFVARGRHRKGLPDFLPQYFTVSAFLPEGFREADGKEGHRREFCRPAAVKIILPVRYKTME
jgi:hypothetical protein